MAAGNLAALSGFDEDGYPEVERRWSLLQRPPTIR
jgi:hypothetical protein